MALSKFHAAALSAVILAGGCSTAEPTVATAGAPTLDERVQVAASAPVALAGQGQIAQAATTQPTSEIDTLTVTPGAQTNTFVGEKVITLRKDFQDLLAAIQRQNSDFAAIRSDAAQDTQGYHGTIAAINSRLQVGTTPGNPVLVRQWNTAQAELDQISSEILKMNRLANDVTASSAMSAYLLEATRAARQLSGAVEEDHRQLRILEDEVQRAVVAIERLLTELSQDINRQQIIIANERSNLNTLALAIKNGQLYGASLSSAIAAGPAQAISAPALQAPPPSDRPLVVIRFDRPNVQYEQPLYSAIRAALERRPASVFEVVAVTPAAAGTTPGAAALATSAVRRQAEQVTRSLTNMGLPPNRVRLTSATSEQAQSGEVQIFVR